MMSNEDNLDGEQSCDGCNSCVAEKEPPVKPIAPQSKKIDSKELRVAVDRFFGFPQGNMVVHQVSPDRYRVNWHLENHQTRNGIEKSAFIKVVRTPDGIVVEDMTIK